MYIGPNCKCGVEFYNHAFFAQQFGLIQMIPLPPFNSLNVDFTDRDIIADRSWAEEVKGKYFDKPRAFSFTPFRELSYSTNNFDTWWCKWISSVQALSLALALKNISLHMKTSDSAKPAEATSSSSTKHSSPHLAEKKRKATTSKGKPNAQAICEFENFYNITFHH